MKLTHVWLEVPPYSDALSLFPDDVTALYPAAPPNRAIDTAQSAQAILASSGIQYDAALLDELPNLRMIVRTGIGVDNVDADACAERGIVFCNTPDGPTESTAEHTVAMMLALAKQLKRGNANLAEGSFGPRHLLVGTEVRGKTLGLIGLGRIGRRVAEICRLGLGMEVIASDPAVTPEQAADLGVKLVEQEEVLANADFLSLHAPAIPATYQLINRESIARMKEGAYLLNLARGPLTDEDAVLEAVESGKLAGVGLDVFDPEPPTLDSPLRNHPKILATPHGASLTVEGRTRIETMAVERVLAYFRGEQPPDIVNPAVLAHPTVQAQLGK